MREQVACKQLDIRFVSSKDQVADGFIEAVGVYQLSLFRNNLNLVCCDRGGACICVWIDG